METGDIIILNPKDLDVFTKSKKFQKELRKRIDEARRAAKKADIKYRYSQGPYIVEREFAKLFVEEE